MEKQTVTLGEVISYFDEQVPNQFSEAEKIKWLNEIDTQIYKDIISTREGADEIVFNGYTEDTDFNTEMLVSKEYSELYRFWLEKSVAFANREINSFNSAMSMFTSYYNNFFCDYNRNHRVLKRYSFTI